MYKLFNIKMPQVLCTWGMARPARFERATFRLGGECSIQLSYGRIYGWYCNEKSFVCQ